MPKTPNLYPLPDIDLQRQVNDKSWRSSSRLESYRHKLARAECDADRVQRIEACECRTCFYLFNSRLAGQAFTNKACEICALIVTYSSTATSHYCRDCAIAYHLCRECGGDLESEKREEIKAPGARSQKAEAWWQDQHHLKKDREARVQKADAEDREFRIVKF